MALNDPIQRGCGSDMSNTCGCINTLQHTVLIHPYQEDDDDDGKFICIQVVAYDLGVHFRNLPKVKKLRENGRRVANLVATTTYTQKKNGSPLEIRQSTTPTAHLNHHVIGVLISRLTAVRFAKKKKNFIDYYQHTFAHARQPHTPGMKRDIHNVSIIPFVIPSVEWPLQK